MRVLLKKNNGRVLIGLCLLLLIYNTAFAQFSVRYAKAYLIGDYYRLDAIFHYRLTEVTIEALKHGVSLPLRLTIKIERERNFLWNETIAILKQKYQLKYYALRRQYELRYLNTGHQEIFGTLGTALTRLSHLEKFPLLHKRSVKDDETYWVYLQIRLDIESLPVSLRPVAYLSPQWRLNSDWYLCPLQIPR